MLAAILILSFATCFTIIYSILAHLRKDELSVAKRLKDVSQLSFNTSAANEELSKPLYTRILKPMIDGMGKAVMRITPRELISSLETKVVRAGNPGNMAVKDWINIEALFIIVLPVITLLAGRTFNAPVMQLLLFVAAEAAMGFVIPGFILSKIITARQKVIQNSLPDVIDLLTVTVEAGLSFDGALVRVVEKKPGPLASELEKVIQEIKMGRQKKDALSDMAKRLDIGELTTFIGAVVQADQFGVGIANVLKIQAEQMREKRKQRAQEKAMKAPVKMLIPMVMFIFPTLFVVLLGPVVIQIIEEFSK